MKRATNTAVIASCVALCVAMVLNVGGAPVGAQPAAARSSVGSTSPSAAVLTVIAGDVLVRSATLDFAPATDGTVLHVGDTVRTTVTARAVLTLFEGSTVELEPGSEITIDEARAGNGSTIVELAQSVGRSWHVVTHLTTADSRYQVRTPAATASVRGTAFEVAIVDGATTVTTSEGRVATSDAAAATEVLVAAEQTTTVRAGAPPEAPAAAPEPQRVVTVTASSPTAIVVDPLGRANGAKDGKVFRQTPGARVSFEDGTIVVTLPDLPEGAIATTVGPDAIGPVTVATTVSERGKAPVTLRHHVRAGTKAVTSGVDVRSTMQGDPEIRALEADEAEKLPDAKVGATPHSADGALVTPSPAPRGTTPLPSASVKKSFSTPRPSKSASR